MNFDRRNSVDPEITEVFSLFFEGRPVSAEVIDTGTGETDFRNTVIASAGNGGKYVLKLAANDFTFPERIGVWQRTAEEYRKLGYYAPRIISSRCGGFPTVDYRGRKCVAYAEEFSKYKPLADRASGEESAEGDRYFDEVWSMTAKIAAKKLGYSVFPSGYCLFETFCPSDETDEALENALEWRRYADTLPGEFSAQTQRIWELWNKNRDSLMKIYPSLPTSVFQADLNPTNLLIDDEGNFRGVYDFNLCGRDVFLNYLMRENYDGFEKEIELIRRALRVSSKYCVFSAEEKAAALPLYRCLKPLWFNRVEELKEAGNDAAKIGNCLDRIEYYLTEDIDFISFM